MNAIRIIQNRLAATQLAHSAAMGRAMGNIAKDAAREVTQRAPSGFRGGAKITADSEVGVGPDGAEGRVVIDSPFWHIPEFGTQNNPPEPYARPGVQAVIARYGGRWKST